MTDVVMQATAVTRRLRALPAAVPPFAMAGVAAIGCLFVGLIDPTRTTMFPPCPFKALTGGLDCPGCGATRGTHQLLNGNLGAALGYNALLMLALPFLLYSWLAWALPTVTTIRLPVLRVPAKAIYGILAVVLLWWLVRNLPFDPLTALHSDR